MSLMKVAVQGGEGISARMRASALQRHSAITHGTRGERCHGVRFRVLKT